MKAEIALEYLEVVYLYAYVFLCVCSHILSGLYVLLYVCVFDACLCVCSHIYIHFGVCVYVRLKHNNNSFYYKCFI